VAKRTVLKLSYFVATFPFLLLSKFAYIFNLWGFKNDVIKCSEIASKYSNVKLPKELLFTLELAEDHRNKLHFGIDQIALGRAILSTLKGSVQGGSTIEQQFVRVVSNKYQRTAKRKLYEQLLAVHVSSLFNKENIAIAYLCIAYFGQSKNGTLRLKNSTDVPFRKLTYSEAIAIVARLKYPEPIIKSDKWLRNIEKRNNHLELKLNTANKSFKQDKKQLVFARTSLILTNYFIAS
jgi:penicillin-binding protein 1A